MNFRVSKRPPVMTEPASAPPPTAPFGERVDLRPAASTIAALVAAVPDDRLDAPTPCADYTVAALVDHIGGFASAFEAAARKEPIASDRRGPGDAVRLEPDWREAIPARLLALADAWLDPDAWIATTAAGGVELPGSMAGLFALDELVVHGWDLARATDQGYAADPHAVAALLDLLVPFADGDRPPDIFGPVVAVADDAAPLDRVLGLTGRDPAWSPPRA